MSDTLLNWRWWVMVPLVAAITVVATIAFVFTVAGVLADSVLTWCQHGALRPIIRWTYKSRWAA